MKIISISHKPGELDIFWIEKDGEIWTKHWQVSDGWKPKNQSITKSAKLKFNSKFSVISRQPNVIEVFWIDQSGAICTSHWKPDGNNGNKWYDQDTITKPNVADPTASITAVSRDENSIDIFWVGESQGQANVCSMHWDTIYMGHENFWHSPVEISGSSAQDIQPTSKSNLAVSYDGYYLDLFWVNVNGGISNANYSTSGFFINNKWLCQAITKNNQLDHDASLCIVWQLYPDVMTRIFINPITTKIIWIAQNGTINCTSRFTSRMHNASSWQSTEIISSTKANVNSTASLAAVSVYLHQLDFFWLDKNNTIRNGQLTYNIPLIPFKSGWWGYKEHIIDSKDPIRDSELTYYGFDPRKMMIFWISTDNNLYYSKWNKNSWDTEVQLTDSGNVISALTQQTPNPTDLQSEIDDRLSLDVLSEETATQSQPNPLPVNPSPVTQPKRAQPTFKKYSNITEAIKDRLTLQHIQGMLPNNLVTENSSGIGLFSKTIVEAFIKIYSECMWISNNEQFLKDQHNNRDAAVQAIIKGTADAVGNVVQDAAGRGGATLSGLGSIIIAIHSLISNGKFEEAIKGSKLLLELIKNAQRDSIGLTGKPEYDIELLAIDISILLYARFQRGIECLLDKRIEDLATFFSEVIIDDAMAGKITMSKTIGNTLTALIKTAIPKEDDHRYDKLGILMTKKIAKFDVKDKDDKNHEIKWSIQGLLLHSPAAVPIVQSNQCTYFKKKPVKSQEITKINKHKISDKNDKENAEFKYQPQIFKSDDEAKDWDFDVAKPVLENRIPLVSKPKP